MTSQKQRSQPYSPLYQNKRCKNAGIPHFGGCTCQLFSSSVPLSFILLNGIQLSFTNWNGFSQTYQWIGLEQYQRLLQDQATWLVVKNTLLWNWEHHLAKYHRTWICSFIKSKFKDESHHKNGHLFTCHDQPDCDGLYLVFSVCLPRRCLK